MAARFEELHHHCERNVSIEDRILFVHSSAYDLHTPVNLISSMDFIYLFNIHSKSCKSKQLENEATW